MHKTVSKLNFFLVQAKQDQTLVQPLLLNLQVNLLIIVMQT